VKRNRKTTSNPERSANIPPVAFGTKEPIANTRTPIPSKVSLTVLGTRTSLLKFLDLSCTSLRHEAFLPSFLLSVHRFQGGLAKP
jgi:hypothetical protein